jgi:hypothetical protein
MKTKYADQDDEERKMRAEMLAPSGPQLTRKQKRELRKGKKSGKPVQASGTQGRWLCRIALLRIFHDRPLYLNVPSLHAALQDVKPFRQR